MKLQRQLENCAWVNETDETRINHFLDMVLERETWYAERVHRQPMTTRGEVLAYLATGQEIRYDNDWYASIRDGEVYERLMAEREARRQPVKMVKCSCGHTVPQGQVMMASLGTACPDCYDRLSN